MSESAASESILERIVGRARRLYSLPAVAARVLELTNKDQIDPSAVKDCIEKDPALAAKILRVANSSLFGFRSEVTSLHQAIGILGNRSLKMLVLSFSLPSELSSNVPAAVLERFWRHTVYRAVAARCFAERFWHIPSDEAFLAGLLGGIGMLALIQDLGETYTQFLDHVHEHSTDVADQEIAVLGFDHAVLSAKMLENWHLPETLVQAVARPRQIARISALPIRQQALASVLHLAELATQFLVTGQPAKLQLLLAAATQFKGLSPRDVHAALENLEAEVAGLADLFQVSPPVRGSFLAMFTEAHAKLSALVEGDLAPTQCAEEQMLANVLQQTVSLHGELGAAVAMTSKSTTDGRNAHRRADAPTAPRGQIRLPTADEVDVERPAPTEVQLPARAAAAIETCRNRRCGISMVMIAIDRYSELVSTAGIEPARQLVRWLETHCARICEDSSSVVAAGDARFALLLIDHDRTEALAVARGLIEALRQRVRTYTCDALRATKLSAGVATLSQPPRNFPIQCLIESARRCLQGAQSSGGNSAKSIEI